MVVGTSFTKLLEENPESVSKQVVDVTVQETKSVVVGTVANPFMVFDVVAPLPQIV